MGWRQTATEVVHRGPFLTLHRDSVIRPDGSVGTYDHVTVKDAVRIVAFDEQGQVALVEDDFYLKRGRVLHLPGGGTEEQAPAVAAARELEEEVGLVADRLRPLAVIDPLPGTTTARTSLCIATGLRPGSVYRDGTEIGMTVRWRPLSDAVAAVETGHITEACSVIGLLLAARARPEDLA